jgi:hypothetical protein
MRLRQSLHPVAGSIPFGCRIRKPILAAAGADGEQVIRSKFSNPVLVHLH